MEINNSEIEEESFFEVLENPKENNTDENIEMEKNEKSEIIKKLKIKYEKEIDFGINLFKKKILESYEKNLEEILKEKKIDEKNQNFESFEKNEKFEEKKNFEENNFEILKEKFNLQKKEIFRLKAKIKKNGNFSKNLEILSKSNEIKILNLKSEFQNLNFSEKKKNSENENFSKNLKKLEKEVDEKFKEQHQREENTNKIGIKHEKDISEIFQKFENLKNSENENFQNLEKISKKLIFYEKNQNFFLEEIENLKKSNSDLKTQNENLLKKINILFEKIPKNENLHKMVKKKNLEKIKEIIIEIKNSKKDINFLDSKKHTALYYAYKSENFEIIKLLKKNFAKLEKDEITKNFLKIIILLSDLENLKILIKKKESENLYPENKKSLIFAFEKNKPKILKILLEKKTDLLIFEKSPFLLIKKNFDKENCLKIIFEEKFKYGMNLNIINKFGNNLIHQASIYGLNKLIEFFIFLKIDQNLENFEKETPIFLAAKNFQKKTVFFLLKKNSNFLIFDKNRNSLLHFICKNNMIFCLKFLISKKIDLNFQNFKNETCLHFAIKEKHDEIVKVLLKGGAGLEVKNLDGVSCYDLLKKEYGEGFSDIFGNIETKLKYD